MIKFYQIEDAPQIITGESHKEAAVCYFNHIGVEVPKEGEITVRIKEL